MPSCLPPQSMHDLLRIYWGNPSSADSKDNANVGSVDDDPPPAAGWLSRCISLRCLCLPNSCQYQRLLMRRCLTLPRRLHLPFASRLPRLVAVLPLVAPPPHIRQLALPSAIASCRVLFLSAPASCCVVSHQPATLQPSLSIASSAHGWLLHLPPAPSSLITVAWPLLMLRHRLPFRLSRASSPSGYCIASTDAATSNLSASPPLILPSPLVAPWPPIPLVLLVVASPLLMPPPPIWWHLHLPLRHCLLSHHGLPYLLSGWLLPCLRHSSSWRAPAS
jgi:hypothetical protein